MFRALPRAPSHPCPGLPDERFAESAARRPRTRRTSPPSTAPGPRSQPTDGVSSGHLGRWRWRDHGVDACDVPGFASAATARIARLDVRRRFIHCPLAQRRHDQGNRPVLGLRSASPTVPRRGAGWFGRPRPDERAQQREHEVVVVAEQDIGANLAELACRARGRCRLTASLQTRQRGPQTPCRLLLMLRLPPPRPCRRLSLTVGRARPYSPPAAES